ncbi:lactonase family protein [Wenjunlia tyrosinilytica]|uniref:6-phosphogluconolactonase n=1 Tax=Wenjunlia tyrosinilytica TaxID=1544741 RepID=A0A918DZV8_9ACTN|nr:lactonase family protein [Wenjunlia tyrosinilytica]GGO91033.1 hypothetical protein GCM10012280_37970 [Wenjunlia tyrosinilytica]
MDDTTGNGAGGGWTRAYLGSFTSSGGRGITVAAVDPDTGALTRITDVDMRENPSFLALSPDRDTLACVLEDEEGAAAAFTLRDRDKPEPLTRVPVRGSAPTHLSFAVGGRAMVIANYGSGSISVLPVLGDGDGGLDTICDLVDHHGHGPVTDRQEGPHAHQVLPDPSDRWILAVDLGTDSVLVYRPDPGSLRLMPHASLKLRGGVGPRHLAFHPSGHVVYVVNELEPVVTVCRWEAEAGRLHEIGEAPMAAPGAGGPDYASNGVVSPDGRFLYVALRGSDTIAVLSLDDSGEVPQRVTAVGCGGAWPRHLAADPSGRRLYAANERSGEVVWFDIDEGTGVPRQAGSLAVPAASCVLFGP